MARGLNGRGVAVAVMGYDLCPNVTIADIIEQARRACVFLWQRFGRKLLVYGHSAGGHLTAAMVATDWHALYPKAPADLAPVGYAISGVFDLTPLVGVSMNQDLRLDAERRAACRRCSGRSRPGGYSTRWSVARNRANSSVRAGRSSRPGTSAKLRPATKSSPATISP
jgi:acetyl esterase/lipase